eukprot:4586097-Heterocapsa_arctica.AAC.1
MSRSRPGSPCRASRPGNPCRATDPGPRVAQPTREPLSRSRPGSPCRVADPGALTCCTATSTIRE